MNVVMTRFFLLLVALAPATALADKTFTTGSGATWDCAQDASVTLNTSGGAYTLKGACTDVTVNGSALQITIESVKTLVINGAKNTLTATAADNIQVNGSSNKVSWTKGVTLDAPDVAIHGTGNTVGGSTSGAATPTTAEADANALDCTKQKNVSITKGKGRFTITGTCDKVAISGGDNTVTIEAAKNLAISGSHNDVTIAKADKIAALGSNNKVTWSAGLTVTTPKTASVGKGNRIVRATATAEPTLPVEPTVKTGAIAPIPVDCSKKATHSITDNDGHYVFKGACTLITVSGNHNSLFVESSKSIAVSGNGNSIDVTSVDKLATSGNDNTARWKKGVTGAKAKVANPGTRNTIAQTP